MLLLNHPHLLVNKEGEEKEDVDELERTEFLVMPDSCSAETSFSEVNSISLILFLAARTANKGDYAVFYTTGARDTKILLLLPCSFAD